MNLETIGIADDFGTFAAVLHWGARALTLLVVPHRDFLALLDVWNFEHVLRGLVTQWSVVVGHAVVSDDLHSIRVPIALLRR